MIFKSPLKKSPREGDQRTRMRFAFFPTRMMPDAETVVWFGYYEEVQRFSPGYGMEGQPHWYSICRTPVLNP